MFTPAGSAHAISYMVSVAEQAGLRLTWVETLKTGFSGVEYQCIFVITSGQYMLHAIQLTYYFNDDLFVIPMPMNIA